MAMFTLIEINGDHLSDLLGKGDDIGLVLQGIVRNTFNAPRLLDEHDLYRVLRVVKQSGESYVDKAKAEAAAAHQAVHHVMQDRGTPQWLDVTTALQKQIDVQARQISALVDGIDESTIMVENDDVRIDILSRRIDALEAWRKS